MKIRCRIVRHQIVKHRASPDDPELADYWAWRRHKAPLPINRTAMRLDRAQDGRCAICKTTLIAASQRPETPRDWEHWLATTRKTIDVVRNTARTDAAPPVGRLRGAGTGRGGAAGAGPAVAIGRDEHRRPWGIEGALAGRCSCVRNADPRRGPACGPVSRP